MGRAAPRAVGRLVGPTLLALGLSTGQVAAHGDGLVTPTTVWGAWTLDPLIIIAIGLTGLLLARGTRAVWQRAGLGRGVTRWQAAAAAGGLVTLALALLSPLAALSEALFVAHMTQHLLLIVVAAPLLVLANPAVSLAWALRAGPIGRALLRSHGLRRVGQWLTLPLVAWTAHTVALWGWHAPVLYQAALRSAALHGLEHLALFGTALLFWWSALVPGRHGRRGYGLSLALLFTMSLQGGLLGALISFARQPWYPAYAAGAAAWGLMPLADQQLAGLLMWLPPGLVYLVATIGLLVAWLRTVERSTSRREQGAGINLAPAERQVRPPSG